MKLAAPTVVNNASIGSRKIPDQYIVVFDESVSDVHGRAAALATITGSRIRFEYHSAIRGFSANMSAQAAAALEKHPGVDFVEQDEIVSASTVQTGATWGLDRIDQSSLPLDGSYSYGPDGSGVNAYVIDAGIRRTHTQFTGRVVPAFTSINDGWGPDGCTYHGTHVAGTIGGVTYGVAKNVTLYSVRVLDCEGNGTMSGVIAGVDWVTANRRLPAVANMSLGATQSDAFNAAVETSINSGVTYVVSAGNQGHDACLNSPASAPNALTVGAITNADAPAAFSNWGPCVDLYAPGVEILSAKSRDDYATGVLTGTSMAAPHVAGAAALYLQLNPGATPAQVGQAIISNATSGALSPVGLGSPNRLLRVNGSGDGEVTPSPTPPAEPSNALPVATFTVKCAQNKNNCSFDASRSYDDLGITSMSWNFGDGSSQSMSTIRTTTHTYTAKGTYTVTLTVTDVGGLSSTSSARVTIKGVSRN